MKIQPPTGPRRTAAAAFFRKEIERIESEGIDRDDMTLRLTLSDVNQLRRDSTLAVSDISFLGGVMRFLGVRIEQGGVATSVLSHTGQD